MVETPQSFLCLRHVFRSINQFDASFYFTANIQHTELFEKALLSHIKPENKFFWTSYLK